MNKTAKNSMIYLAGTIIMAILGFLNTMLLTRVLSPKVYAMYGLLTNFITTGAMLAAFGYDKAYMRFYYACGYTKRRFLVKCLLVPACILSLVLLACMEPSQTLMTYVFGEGIASMTVLLVCGYLCVSVMNKFTHLTARMEEHAGNYVVSEAVGKSGFVVVVLLLYYICKDVSFEQVVISFLIAGTLASLINITILFKVKDGAQEGKRIRHGELLQYGLPLMINNVIALLVPTIEKMFIRDLTSWEILGLYTSAAFLQTVMLLLQQTLTNVWTPLVYKLCDTEEKLKPLLHSVGLMCSLISVVCLVCCTLLRRYIVLILDSKYYSVYEIMPTIMFGACANIIALVYSVGIEIRKKTKILILIPVLQGIISVGLCFALAPSLGIKGVAIATLISLFASNGLRCLIGLRLYSSGQTEWKSFAIICIGIIAALASLFFTRIQDDILIAGSVMLLTILIMNKDILTTLRMMKGLLSSQKKKS